MLNEVAIAMTSIYFVFQAFLCCCKSRKKNIFEIKHGKVSIDGKRETINLELYNEKNNPQLIESINKNDEIESKTTDNKTNESTENKTSESTENKTNVLEKPLIDKINKVEKKEDKKNTLDIKDKNVFVFNFSILGVKDDITGNVFTQLFDFINAVELNGNPKKDKIIMRINSPGGYAYLYEEAYIKLVGLKQQGFEIIGIIDNICASGGYMLACACSKIYASETAKIGSIGVIGTGFNYKDLLDKVGVKGFKFATSEFKGGFPSFTEYTEKDIENQYEDLNNTFEMFKSIVKKNRPNVQDESFNAKVWYTSLPETDNAITRGLVDNIGYYNTLINEYKKDYNIYITSEKEESFVNKLLKLNRLSNFQSNIIDTFVEKFIMKIKKSNSRIENLIC